MADGRSFQTGINTNTMDKLTDYSLFMGGLNVTHDALLQYDPLKTGFGRIFMIRKPAFLDSYSPGQLKKYKHMLEYGNIGVNGINNITVDFEQMTGGYVGKSFDIPMIAKDDTNAFTVKTYELSGSLMREVTTLWITGVADLMSGLSHYHGVNMPVTQANHTAEFIYLNTDQTGKRVEYACLLANCFPKDIKEDHFNYDAGQHALVPLDLEFSCTKYVSPQINEMAALLLNKYNVLMNCLDFNSGFTKAALDAQGVGTIYDSKTGKLIPTPTTP